MPDDLQGVLNAVLARLDRLIEVIEGRPVAPGGAPGAARRAPRPDDLLTIKEVGAELQLCQRSVYLAVHRKLLPPPLRLMGASRWLRRDVDRLKDGTRRLRKRRAKPIEETPAPQDAS